VDSDEEVDNVQLQKSEKSQRKPSQPLARNAGVTSKPEPEEEEEEDSNEVPNDVEREEQGESDLEGEDDEVAGQMANLALKRNLVDVDPKGGSWKIGDPIPYAALTHTFSLIEATTKRLEITAILTSFFLNVIQRSKEGDADGLRMSVYLCINRVSHSLPVIILIFTGILP
jgi:DNA ligase 1